MSGQVAIMLLAVWGMILAAGAGAMERRERRHEREHPETSLGVDNDPEVSPVTGMIVGLVTFLAALVFFVRLGLAVIDADDGVHRRWGLRRWGWTVRREYRPGRTR